MAWGMECSDGWYKLLDDCMKKMQYFCDLCSKDDREVQVVAAQIKEKYGTLRFYVDVYGANDVEDSIIDDIVREAEYQSERTCEVTGKDGSMCKKGGWYRTLSYEEARRCGYVACDQNTENYWKEKDAKQESPEDLED